MKRTYIGLALWINFIHYSSIKAMDKPPLLPFYTILALEMSEKKGLEKGLEQGRKESQEEIAKLKASETALKESKEEMERLKASEANFRNAQREITRLLGIDLIQSEQRNADLKIDLAKSDQRTTTLKDEVRKKVDELNELLECLEDSHPCAKPPTATLRRIIEELKQLTESK